MEKYIVDRFEDNLAVLEKEEGGTVDVDRSFLPDAKEGDVIIKNGDVYTVDETETEKRQAAIKEKLKKLFRKH